MRKFSYHERQQLKQLVIETEIQRLPLKESIAYIRTKSNLEISQRYYYNIQKIVRENSLKRLHDFQHSRYAYLYEYFARIDEIRKYQQHLWSVINANPDDGLLRKGCITELHQLTITLTNLYEMLPEYSSALATNSQTITENSSQQEEQTPTQRVFT